LRLDSLASKTRGKTLSQFVSLFGICHNKSIQVAGAADLELGLAIALADLYQLGVGATGLLQKVANVSDLLGHGYKICKE
jgi:hypothetical protein